VEWHTLWEEAAVKNFLLKSTEIRVLVPGLGFCFATDQITVEGRLVGYMYREAPEGGDSGWRFFSGWETQDYVDDPSHTSIYDVNTIANYDQSILPWLDSPVGAMFERAQNGDWIRVE